MRDKLLKMIFKVMYGYLVLKTIKCLTFKTNMSSLLLKNTIYIYDSFFQDISNVYECHFYLGVINKYETGHKTLNSDCWYLTNTSLFKMLVEVIDHKKNQLKTFFHSYLQVYSKYVSHIH